MAYGLWKRGLEDFWLGAGGARKSEDVTNGGKMEGIRKATGGSLIILDVSTFSVIHNAGIPSIHFVGKVHISQLEEGARTQY